MCKKAETFQDEEARLAIMSCASPGEAKKWGRRIRNFSDEKWDKVKVGIMYEGIVLKTEQHPDLKRKLLETHGALLVERLHSIPFGGSEGTGRDQSLREECGCVGGRSFFLHSTS